MMRKTDERSAIEIYAERVQSLREKLAEERKKLKAEVAENVERFKVASEEVGLAAQSGSWNEYKMASDRKNELEMKISWEKGRLSAMKKECLVSQEEAAELEALQNAALEEMEREYEENKAVMAELVRQMISVGLKNKYKVNLLNSAENDLGYYILHNRSMKHSIDGWLFQKDKITPFINHACPGKQKRVKGGFLPDTWFLTNPFSEGEEYEWSNTFNWC